MKRKSETMKKCGKGGGGRGVGMRARRVAVVLTELFLRSKRVLGKTMIINFRHRSPSPESFIPPAPGRACWSPFSRNTKVVGLWDKDSC